MLLRKSAGVDVDLISRGDAFETNEAPDLSAGGGAGLRLWPRPAHRSDAGRIVRRRLPPAWRCRRERGWDAWRFSIVLFSRSPVATPRDFGDSPMNSVSLAGACHAKETLAGKRVALVSSGGNASARELSEVVGAS